ncbi:unnamed protein product [Paramecium octaurelia]|uniref:Cathepsin propeptide inhibitor domain-containing protein n=1 Tax=Paramecium octaurelia TaxID=43137 RepID=A0A8S1V7B4_PAROT|nr:unnamed protein product [Paramecium octaurelia]
MNKPLIALLTTVLHATTSYLGQEDPLRTLYQEWKQKYETRYTSQFEDEYRFEIFKQNYNYYQEVNSRQSNYTLGINQFATLTDEEFESIYLIFLLLRLMNLLLHLIFLNLLIGHQKLIQLRTKVHVDQAGHSQPLVLLKPFSSLLREHIS